MRKKRSALDTIKEIDVPGEERHALPRTDHNLLQGLIAAPKTTFRFLEDLQFDSDYSYTEPRELVKIFDARQSNRISMRYLPFDDLKF